MEISNELIRDVLKEAYKANPKNTTINGTKLIEAHENIRKMLVKLFDIPDVSNQRELLIAFCKANHQQFNLSNAYQAKELIKDFESNL